MLAAGPHVPNNNRLSFIILFLLAYCLLLTFQHLYEISQLTARQGKQDLKINSALLIRDRPLEVTKRIFDSDMSNFGLTKLKINALDTKRISDIDFLIMVPSSPTNIELRSRIRQTWGSAPSSFRHKQVFFFFGRSEDPKVDEQLVEENKRHGDVIQADFLDSYYNLTLKTLSMLYWAHFRISTGKFNPRWIMKCDDDNFVDIFRLEDYLHSVDLGSDEILCCVREDAVPSRVERKDKWFVEADLWNEPLYPKMCFGPAYFISTPTIPYLIAAHETRQSPLLPFEDVYVTGVLARDARLNLRNFREDIFTNYLGGNKVIIHSAAAAWSEETFYRQWDLAQERAYGAEHFAAVKALQLHKQPDVEKAGVVQSKRVQKVEQRPVNETTSIK